MPSAKDSPETAAGKSGKHRVKAATKDGAEGDVGSLLRRVFDTTVEEPVPDGLLSLLGKLD